MANYPQELAQDAVCQSHTGRMTGLWFLPTRPLRLNKNEWMKCFKILHIFRCHGLNRQVQLQINTVGTVRQTGKFDCPSVILKINQVENNFSHTFRTEVLMFYQTFKLFVIAQFLENLRRFISSSSRTDFGEDNANINAFTCLYLVTYIYPHLLKIYSIFST